MDSENPKLSEAQLVVGSPWKVIFSAIFILGVWTTVMAGVAFNDPPREPMKPFESSLSKGTQRLGDPDQQMPMELLFGVGETETERVERKHQAGLWLRERAMRNEREAERQRVEMQAKRAEYVVMWTSHYVLCTMIWAVGAAIIISTTIIRSSMTLQARVLTLAVLWLGGTILPAAGGYSAFAQAQQVKTAMCKAVPVLDATPASME